MATPIKAPRHSRSKSTENLLYSENSNPNLIPFASPPNSSKKPIKTPASKSVPAKKSEPRNPVRPVDFPAPAPPPPRPRDRKFIVAKKNLKRKDGSFDFKKCREEAYEALRASQEEFFRKERSETTNPTTVGEISQKDEACNDQINESREKFEVRMDQINGSVDRSKVLDPEINESEELGLEGLEGSSKVRKIRSMVMKEAMNSVPEPGSGRVKHLVQAFESLLSIGGEESEKKRGEEEEEEEGERKQRVINWALPGLHRVKSTNNNNNNNNNETHPVSLSSSAEFITFGGKDRDERDSRVYSSTDSNVNRLSWESRTSGGGRRSRRNSSDSLKSWNKKLKVTSQHPFKLRTEQRGRMKEEQFIKKVEEMLSEAQNKRIPIAQGLPWTTDEPECLVKPPVKEITEPIDLVLHSDVRAVERAEFDNYVAERLKYVEDLRLERERQRKMEEEEEIRRLRRELVPKAQPMPYFDRPFIPKKSTRPRTIPKDPRFHIRPVKPACVSESMESMFKVS